MVLPVTFTLIALCAALLMPGTAWIGLLRGRLGILRGDGGDPVLFKRTRIYGNFVEIAPLTCLALGAAEVLGLAAAWLWAGVVCFFAGRLLHYVLYDSKTRGGAMGLSVLPAFLAGIWVLWKLWLA